MVVVCGLGVGGGSRAVLMVVDAVIVGFE